MSALLRPAHIPAKCAQRAFTSVFAGSIHLCCGSNTLMEIKHWNRNTRVPDQTMRQSKTLASRLPGEHAHRPDDLVARAARMKDFGDAGRGQRRFVARRDDAADHNLDVPKPGCPQ